MKEPHHMQSPTTATTSSFADLGVAPDLVRALAGLGITTPFPIQSLTIPDATAGKDVCGKAQTGSGKTLAFGIPLIERTEAADHPRSLVLVPTRELCRQVAADLEPLAAARDLEVVAIYGGVPIRRQVARIRSGADVLVATPGRVIDLVERGHLSLRDVSTVVIDEADQMADMGFLPQVHAVMGHIGGGHQTMLFSATLDGQIRSLVTRYLTDPIRYEVEAESEVDDAQTHRFLAVHHMDKPKVAAAIARNSDRTLVFVATKRSADRVASAISAEGVEARAIHGDLRQEARERTLAAFADGRLPVMVATNLAARGLHVADVDVVMHYDPPADYKSFIHRSGRTARAGDTGLVVTLVEWDQVAEVQRLQRASGLHTEITKMYSNDPRLADLAAFEPEAVEFKQVSSVELSRRAGRRRRRR
jgi:superfamily II DNA/RNA helicase